MPARVVRVARAVAVSWVFLVVVGCGGVAPRPGPGEAAQARVLSFRVLDSGAQSGITSPQERVVGGAEEWERLWQAHQARGFPRRLLPAADFVRELCIAIVVGERPTGGFAVRVEQVVESAAGIEVVYRVTAPAPGAIVSQVLTSPFVMISVARRPGAVRFRRLPES